MKSIPQDLVEELTKHRARIIDSFDATMSSGFKDGAAGTASMAELLDVMCGMIQDDIPEDAASTLVQRMNMVVTLSCAAVYLRAIWKHGDTAKAVEIAKKNLGEFKSAPLFTEGS